MKKIILLFLLCVAPLGADAKSFKLGDFDLGKIFAKSNEKVCTSNDQCKTSLCVSGKCVYCDSKTNACPAGKVCRLGMCVEDAGCENDSDCSVGRCNPETSRCVECLDYNDCKQGNTGYGFDCDLTTNQCYKCPAGSNACGNCFFEFYGKNMVPDGNGGCGCAEDAFNNGGTCVKYCDLTTCKADTTKQWDGYTACCCR